MHVVGLHFLPHYDNASFYVCIPLKIPTKYIEVYIDAVKNLKYPQIK